MTIEIELKGQLTAREAGRTIIVPIWIGERHWYWDKTLIQSYVTFSGPAGAPLSASATYSLVCSPSCNLTPSGPKPPLTLIFPSWWFGNRPSLGARIGVWTWYMFARGFVWLWPPSWGGKYTEYRTDGQRMILSAGYYDRGNVPFFRWWYGNRTITVECGGGAGE